MGSLGIEIEIEIETGPVHFLYLYLYLYGSSERCTQVHLHQAMGWADMDFDTWGAIIYFA
jgi:hypothetical protein